jgi:hypothetical protein
VRGWVRVTTHKTIVAGSSSVQGQHHRMGHKNPTRDSFLSAVPKISDSKKKATGAKFG